MNPNIFRQNDPRWGGLAYKTAPYTVASEGCGLLSVTHCAIEQKKYWKSTPKTFYSFMKQYATNGDGIEWVGIDEGLKKYIGNAKRHYTMDSLWTELDKGNRVGVILFGSGIAPDGTQWSKGGHYVAFVSYKREGGSHWLYTKDSSSRCLDGWRSYERSMRGCIPNIMWTAELRKEGWIKENGAWYYYKEGQKEKNTWLKDDGKWYFLGADGRMRTGWLKWKDNWYYLKENGVMASSEWVKDPKGWCYVDKDGKMLKGTWLKWKNNFYYIDGRGYMVTGERNVPCTFSEDGKLEATK